MSKKAVNLIIGGDFNTQPQYKPKIVPEDFLAQFRNVKPYKTENIVDFANNYSFGGYLIPDRDNSIREKFVSIQEKYNPIIDKLVADNTLNYSDILTINKDLKHTAPAISLHDKVNDLDNIEGAFSIYTLNSVSSEEPICKIQRIGAFDVDEKAAHVKIEQTISTESKSIWYYQKVRDGVTRIQEIFPWKDWGNIEEKYLRSVILQDSRITLDNNGYPVSIEMNLRLGKTDFRKEELASVWSPTTGESFIAKRVWDYLNTEYKGNKFHLCKVCGNLHIGRSPNHCPKNECKREWDSKRKSLKTK